MTCGCFKSAGIIFLKVGLLFSLSQLLAALNYSRHVVISSLQSCIVLFHVRQRRRSSLSSLSSPSSSSSLPGLMQTSAIMAFQYSLSSVLLMSSLLGYSFLVTKLFRLYVYCVPCLPLLLVQQIFPINKKEIGLYNYGVSDYLTSWKSCNLVICPLLFFMVAYLCARLHFLYLTLFSLFMVFLFIIST